MKFKWVGPDGFNGMTRNKIYDEAHYRSQIKEWKHLGYIQRIKSSGFEIMEELETGSDDVKIERITT